jgi:putative NADPH-quinone reductase
VALVLTSMAALLLVTAGVASAASAPGGDTPLTSTGDTPVHAVLAKTGLNLTAPIVLGLSILLLGTALVAWAVLHGSGRSRRAQD